jgi:hypothetical protein
MGESAEGRFSALAGLCLGYLTFCYFACCLAAGTIRCRILAFG